MEGADLSRGGFGAVLLVAVALATACGTAGNVAYLDPLHGCPPPGAPRGAAMHFTSPAFPDFDPVARASDTGASIYGYVRAAEDSVGLDSVIVTLRSDPGRARYTSSDGRYQIDAQIAESDTILYMKLGYFREELPIAPDSGRTRVDAELVPYEVCIQ